ncbi:hypothetical protein fHeYen902_197 [Yersinia phage fHe-Yen9-02]|nr:hypothetical protein fHeYen902_197 [Yersinia phage fHe-Yen9-02]
MFIVNSIDTMHELILMQTALLKSSPMDALRQPDSYTVFHVPANIPRGTCTVTGDSAKAMLRAYVNASFFKTLRRVVSLPDGNYMPLIIPVCYHFSDIFYINPSPNLGGVACAELQVPYEEYFNRKLGAEKTLDLNEILQGVSYTFLVSRMALDAYEVHGAVLGNTPINRIVRWRNTHSWNGITNAVQTKYE